MVSQPNEDGAGQRPGGFTEADRDRLVGLGHSHAFGAADQAGEHCSGERLQLGPHGTRVGVGQLKVAQHRQHHVVTGVVVGNLSSCPEPGQQVTGAEPQTRNSQTTAEHVHAAAC